MNLTSNVGKPKVGLVQFLGSNCDVDCLRALKEYFGIELEMIWHTQSELPKIDGLIIPGGFSYGDFLRSGALASHSKIMASIKKFAGKGGAILGICNGFQILTESRLLPGALLKNNSGRFICKYLNLEKAEGDSGYHTSLGAGEFNVPVAHGDGRYFISEDGLKKLKDQGQILFRYQDNPNGSVDNIAGIVSENGRVMGMMPHPERAVDKLVGGSDDGRWILRSFLESCL